MARGFWRAASAARLAKPRVRSWSLDWPTSAAGFLLILLFLGLHAWNPPLIEAARLKVFDQYMRIKPRQPPQPSPVVIVDIDEISLEDVGQWPWPRTVFARLIDRLAEMGAAVIAFDVIFSEADRLSPAEFAASLDGLDPTIVASLGALPDNDTAMAAAMERHRVILGQPASTQPLVQAAAASAPPMTVASINGDPRPYLVRFADLVRSVPVLEEAAQGVGLVTFDADLDGVVRRVPAVVDVSGRIVPTLAIEALRVATGQPTIATRSGEGGIEAIVLQGVAIPTDGQAQIWIHYTPHQPDRYVSAADVLDGRVDPARIAGRIAIVGSSAAALGDIKATPVSARMPGVEVHAQLLETIYTNDHLRRPSYAPGAERVFFVGMGLVLAIAGPLLPAGLLPVVLLVSVLGTISLSWYAFAAHSLLIDAAYPAFAIVALVLWLALAKYIREQAMRRSIRGAFGQYLSPVMVDQLVSDPQQLKLTGDTRELSIMFCDIRDFTTLSESYANAPEDLTRFMNRYLTAMTEQIMERSGTIDKYIGDAIMAFWNAPLDVPHHARLACLAALGMTKRVRELGEEAQATGADRAIRIGVGINSGECYVGNLGSEQRFNYSVLGDPVNVASRLEGQTKTYGVEIIVGDTTMAGAPDLAGLRLDLVRLKGKTQPVWLFGLLGDAELAGSKEFVALARAHDAMLETYRRQDWDGAERQLTGCQAFGKPFRLGRLYDLYAERILALRQDPPGPDWDGVYVAPSK
jgi:adenylate cyclase